MKGVIKKKHGLIKKNIVKLHVLLKIWINCFNNPIYKKISVSFIDQMMIKSNFFITKTHFE